MKAARASRRSAPSDKRSALLEAALTLFARDGLHNVTTAAVSRAAGVATGTLFVYFRSKEELITSLYLEAAANLLKTMEGILDEASPGLENFRRIWFSRARWHLANPAASSFIRQCEASNVLPPETVAAKAKLEEQASARFDASLRSGAFQAWPRQVHFALLEGPILILAHLRDKGEIEVTDEILEMTFQGVATAMLR